MQAGTNLFTEVTAALDVALTDKNGLAYFCKGTGAPATTAGIFAHGCLFIQTDSGSGNAALYENTGTTASPVWNLVGSIAAGDIAAGAVTLAKLASGITPSHVVKYAGTFTTLGGDATEVITVTGLAATDIVDVVVKTSGATPRTILAWAVTTNTITVTMSGDPSTDHVLQYVAHRAAA